MAAITCFFIFALFCYGHSQPIGQTTLCESQSMPNLLQAPSTTVCETTPNLLTPNLLNLGLNPFLNNLAIPLPIPYNPVMPNVGSTTVCESQPNLGIYGPLPLPLPIPYPGIGLPYPGGCPNMASTTVCETSPNLYNPMGMLPSQGTGSTTVCESTSNSPLNMAGLYPLYPGLMPNPSTTVCESTPNIGMNGLYGLPFGLRPRLPLSLGYPGLVY